MILISMSFTVVSSWSRDFLIPDRSGYLLLDARRQLRPPVDTTPTVLTWRDTNQLLEPGGEGPEGGATNLEADLGHAPVAHTQQSHRPLDSPGHQVAVWGLTESSLELTAEVSGGHMRFTSERIDVKGERVLTVHTVPRSPQSLEVLQPSGGHVPIIAGSGKVKVESPPSAVGFRPSDRSRGCAPGRDGQGNPQSFRQQMSCCSFRQARCEVGGRHASGSSRSAPRSRSGSVRRGT